MLLLIVKQEVPYIDQEPGGVSLAGDHTNFHAYFNIVQTITLKNMDVCRSLAGGCGQEDQ